jgi:iron complex outermembrane recepter protein
VVNYVGPMRLIDNWGESLVPTPYTSSLNNLPVYEPSAGEAFPGYGVKDPSQVCGVYGANGLPFAGCKLRSFTTFDLFGKYTGIKNWELSASVQNLFNSLPPLDPYTYGGANYNPAWHQSGAIGRYFTFGAKYKF